VRARSRFECLFQWPFCKAEEQAALDARLQGAAWLLLLTTSSNVRRTLVCSVKRHHVIDKHFERSFLELNGTL